MVSKEGKKTKKLGIKNNARIIWINQPFRREKESNTPKKEMLRLIDFKDYYLYSINH